MRTARLRSVSLSLYPFWLLRVIRLLSASHRRYHHHQVRRRPSPLHRRTLRGGRNIKSGTLRGEDVQPLGRGGPLRNKRLQPTLWAARGGPEVPPRVTFEKKPGR